MIDDRRYLLPVRGTSERAGSLNEFLQANPISGTELR